MRIVLAEDEYLQEQAIIDTIQQHFPKADIQAVQSEHGFRVRLGEFESEPPDVFVVDVMLTWDYAEPDAPAAPSEVLGNSARAGIRCVEILRNSDRLKSVPIIIFTVLDSCDVEADIRRLSPLKVIYAPKESGYQALVEQIQALSTKRRGPQRRP